MQDADRSHLRGAAPAAEPAERAEWPSESDDQLRQRTTDAVRAARERRSSIESATRSVEELERLELRIGALLSGELQLSVTIDAPGATRAEKVVLDGCLADEFARILRTRIRGELATAVERLRDLT